MLLVGYIVHLFTYHLLSVSDNILSKFLSNILVLYINSYSITLLAHLQHTDSNQS